MSYNSYNYSPYYQQQTHKGSALYPAVNTPEHYGADHGYPSYRSTAVAGEENTEQSTKTGTQPSSNYYDNTPRPYTDTSALGSLAYVSALGRDGKSIDQNKINSNQPQDPVQSNASQFSYGSNTAAANGYSQARSDSRSSINTNRNTGLTNTSSASPYAASIAVNALAQTQQLNRVASPQYHHRPEQTTNRHTTPAAQNPGYSSKSLGQSYTIGSQNSPSVNAANAISLPPVQNTKSREPSKSNKPQYRASTPAAYSMAQTETNDASNRTDMTPYQAVPPTQFNQGPAAFSTSCKTSYYGTHTHSRESSTVDKPREDRHASAGQFTTTNTGSNQISSHLSQNAKTDRNTQPEIDHHPITVNPNQVFNVYEYQRRKAEAEAEAAKKAADQRSPQDRPATLSAGNMKQAATVLNPAVGAAVGPSTKPAETGSKEQIEAEIKAMIEKMREYKAKDPAVFSEVWERFKQVQPPPGASSQSQNTPKESQEATFASRQDREIASPGFMDNGSLPSPSPVLAQHPSIPGNHPDNLPDLGRFPYQRRRRGKNDKGKANGSQMSDVLNAEDLDSSRLDTPFIDPRLSPSDTSTVMQMGDQQKTALTATPSREQTAHKTVDSFQSGYEANAAKPTPSYPSPYNARIPKPSTSTIWPEHKKTALAIVGKHILESAAANTGKTITVDDIRSLLDQDPSYDQLCQTLESRGFVFERAKFARRLLDAVPHTNTDPQTPMIAIGPVEKPRRVPASDSPRRPRGRPRKDGLPPRQTHAYQKEAALTTPTAPPEYPNSYTPASYFTTSGLGNNQSQISVQDSGDQNLASALKTAISEIDNQSFGPGANDRPLANTSRPYMNISRPLETFGKSNSGTTNYSAGDAARDALKWSASRQYSLETLKNDNMINPQTGKLVHSMSRPSPLVNGTHPGFGGHNISGSQVNVGQLARKSNPQVSCRTEVSTPNVLTKEQMARKRNFNEIVDLTQDVDEEFTQEQKRARLGKLTSRMSINGGDNIGNVGHSHLAKPTAPEVATTADAVPTITQSGTPFMSSISATADNGKIDLSQFKAANTGTISSRETLRLGDVVQELNKNDALKKSHYNVKTLARDILISKGIHPTERPLNWHLDSLRGNFRGVTNTSDLSTFRWDLVDPGGPRISHVECEAESKAQDDDSEVQKTTHIPTYTPTRGRPRGRPPRSRGAVHGNSSNVRSLDAFRDDVTSLVRSMRPSRGGRGSRSCGSSHLQTSTTRQSPRSANFIDMADGTIPNHMSAPPQSVVSSATEPSILQTSLPNRVNNGSEDNRLRFGSDGSADASMAPVAEYGARTSLVVRVPSLTSGLDQSSSTTPRSRDRSTGSANKSSTSETGSKKRGRPVGSGTPSRGRPSGRGRPITYRTEVPDDGIGILIPFRSPSTSSHLSHVEAIPEVEKKKKGKKSRQAVSPSFQVFKCQWQGCGSELHNLETLRKHIYIVHGRAETSGSEASVEAAQKRIPCLWNGCEQEGVFSNTTGTMKFEDRDSWKAHVERGHLETVAWELGDGPSTHPSDVEPSSYLSDSQGRTVTPLARTTGPPDPLPPGSGRSPTRAYHRAHSNITEHQKSQAELNSQVATKQVAGVFIGRDSRQVQDPQVDQESSDEESDSDDR